LLPRTDGSRRLRLAFASDFHIGPTTPPVLLDQAFEQLARFAPDALLLGGDYVYLDATQPRVDELEARLARLPMKTKLAVLGNHDLWTDHPAIERALARGGASVLVNRSEFLPPPFDDVAIVGLDEPWTGSPDMDAALAGSERARLRIGLCHSPDGCAYFSGRRVSLLACGHTHGGQIALPGRPIYLPPGPYSRRYPHGLHSVDDFLLFVSRGVGTTELPIRIFAPADIAVFELTEVSTK
jgi:hypothetical protein